jgi:DNA-binding response OmpR family regulator
VLLTDVAMPQMLGKEAAERIRALRPGVTVLFMSGYARGVLDPQGVVEAGVNLIQKPFSEAELLATLRHTIASATHIEHPRRQGLHSGSSLGCCVNGLVVSRRRAPASTDNPRQPGVLDGDLGFSRL